MPPVPVSETIRQLRKSLGLTQQQFAVELGLSVTAVANYEQGGRMPALPQLLAFRAAAERAGRDEIAAALAAHIVSRFGWHTPEDWAFIDVVPLDEFEALAVDGFLRCLRRPGTKALASTALAAIDAARQLASTPEERSGLGALRTADRDRKLIEEAIARGYAQIIDGHLVWQASGQDTAPTSERTIEPRTKRGKQRKTGS